MFPGNLESLTTLKADNNQLTSLPSTIGGYVYYILYLSLCKHVKGHSFICITFNYKVIMSCLVVKRELVEMTKLYMMLCYRNNQVQYMLFCRSINKCSML